MRAQVVVEEVPLATLAKPQQAKGADGKTAADLRDCRRALDEARQRAASLEATIQRLEAERAVAGVPRPPADVSALQEQIRVLEGKLSAAESRPSSPPLSAAAPGAVSQEAVQSTKSSLFYILVLAVVLALMCYGVWVWSQKKDEDELQQQSLPPGTRWQESPMPNRNRAPDRTPGSPVRPFRGHVNLSGSKSPFRSPAGLG